MSPRLAIRCLAALTLSCAAWAQTGQSFDLYNAAVAAKAKQAGKPKAEYTAIAKSLLQYATCQKDDCAESLKRFAEALCSLEALDAGHRNEALGQLVYDAARVRETSKAVQLLAHLQARYPQIRDLHFVYTASGTQGELSLVLSEGMRLERAYSRPMDENPGMENFSYNIPVWDRDSLKQLSQAAASVAKATAACAPIRP